MTTDGSQRAEKHGAPTENFSYDAEKTAYFELQWGWPAVPRRNELPGEGPPPATAPSPAASHLRCPEWTPADQHIMCDGFNEPHSWIASISGFSACRQLATTPAAPATSPLL